MRWIQITAAELPGFAAGAKKLELDDLDGLPASDNFAGWIPILR